MGSILKAIKENLLIFVIVLVGLWSILLQIDAKDMQEEINDVSADIKLIRAEQSETSYKLKQWKAEMEQELNAVKTDKVIEEQATRGWYRDVPLSESLQEYTAYVCGQYGVDYDIVLAVMAVESNYKADVISNTGDWGIMQINEVNHTWLADMGLTNMLDARQNIKAGVYILADLLDKYEGDYYDALRAYNCGVSGANRGGGRSYADKVMREVE